MNRKQVISYAYLASLYNKLVCFSLPQHNQFTPSLGEFANLSLFSSMSKNKCSLAKNQHSRHDNLYLAPCFIGHCSMSNKQNKIKFEKKFIPKWTEINQNLMCFVTYPAIGWQHRLEHIHESQPTRHGCYQNSSYLSRHTAAEGLERFH